MCLHTHRVMLELVMDVWKVYPYVALECNVKRIGECSDLVRLTLGGLICLLYFYDSGFCSNVFCEWLFSVFPFFCSDEQHVCRVVEIAVMPELKRREGFTVFFSRVRVSPTSTLCVCRRRVMTCPALSVGFPAVLSDGTDAELRRLLCTSRVWSRVGTLYEVLHRIWQIAVAVGCGRGCRADDSVNAGRAVRFCDKPTAMSWFAAVAKCSCFAGPKTRCCFFRSVSTASSTQVGLPGLPRGCSFLVVRCTWILVSLL